MSNKISIKLYRFENNRSQICLAIYINNYNLLYRLAQAEADAIRQETASVLPHVIGKTESTKSLKPVPSTSSGIIGWLAAKFVIFIIYTETESDSSSHYAIY